ncbi:MAG: stalk domain-containing protein [Syntrophomonadales bacterium]
MSQTIDCAPVISPSGRTFVPLRFIIETLEAEVKYDPSNGQILITR